MQIFLVEPWDAHRVARALSRGWQRVVGALSDILAQINARNKQGERIRYSPQGV